MYIRQLILLFSFVLLIFQISFNADKKEMEVSYLPKENDQLPVISICTFFEDMATHCKEKNDFDYSEIFKNKDYLEFIHEGKFMPSYFFNKTTKELYEFERRCNFIDNEDLVYVFNNTYNLPSKLTTYLNFGLFCKLYEFNITTNYNDGFFKIDSMHRYRLTVFMHERDTYPSDINLKIYYSEFRNNTETILILLELNKMIRSSSSLFEGEDNNFNSSKDCFMNCFKSKNLFMYNFRYLKDEKNHLILNNTDSKTYELSNIECLKKCNFNELFESYFKQEKITHNCDMITNFNKSLSLKSWIIFFQQPRVVTFTFNSVITVTVYLIYLCNAVSLIFGLSFFSLLTSIVIYVNKYIKFRLKTQNFKFSMIIISMLMSFLQSQQIIGEYFKYLTTTDLVMNLPQTMTNLSLSICFSDLLIRLAPNYDLRKNEFTNSDIVSNNYSNLLNINNSRHFGNLSVDELVHIIENINIKALFDLRILIVNKFKYVNIMKENTKVFLRNGRYCYQINLRPDIYLTRSTNRVKALIENECYLYIELYKDTFEFFFLTAYTVFPSFENAAYIYENSFRLLEETHPDKSDTIYCLNYEKHHSTYSRAIQVERCLILNYFSLYKKLPIDITFIPEDDFWYKNLNLTNDQLFFDTHLETTRRMKLIKEKCLRKYEKLDCKTIQFNSVNSRMKDKYILKLSLYFDKVLINHKNKIELISLVNYLVGIFSLWLGLSFRQVELYSKKILSKFLTLKQSQALIDLILLIGLIAHGYYIINLLVENDLIAITYFQSSKYILHPLVSLCFELEQIYSDSYHAKNRYESEEVTGKFLKEHTKNLSQLVKSIRFLGEDFKYNQINASNLSDFEGRKDHFIYKNLEIEFFFYLKYKCYEIKHKFKNKRIDFNADLEIIFLEINLVNQDLELLFYANRCFSLENKIFIPKYSYTTLKYIPILTIPNGESLSFCLDHQDDSADRLIRQVRRTLENNNYRISTKLLPLTHSYFQYSIRDEIFYNALHVIEENLKNTTSFVPEKNCSIKYRNIVLTQKLDMKNDVFKIQINPMFIDVIVEQQAKYSLSEQILQFDKRNLKYLKMNATFLKDKHIKFLNRMIDTRMNKDNVFMDSSRMTIVYFILSSFDLLDSFDEMDWEREKIIEAIYSYQIKSDESDNQPGRWGFRSSFANGVDNQLDSGHIALTYCALCSLIICGDDLKRVNRTRILSKLSEYQKDNGSYYATLGGENDMRFVFCVSAVCYILNDFSTINVDKMVDFIMKCLTYEGAFAQLPGAEAHGGSSYCAIASLKLLGKLDDCLNNKKRAKLIRWLLMKQDQGFEGRPNKASDTCYTSWIGASLAILGQHHLINHKRLKNFCLKNQDYVHGGFGKQFDSFPDPMHTYMTLSGLSIEEGSELNLGKIVPELNISERAFKHLQNVISSF